MTNEVTVLLHIALHLLFWTVGFYLAIRRRQMRGGGRGWHWALYGIVGGVVGVFIGFIFWPFVPSPFPIDLVAVSAIVHAAIGDAERRSDAGRAVDVLSINAALVIVLLLLRRLPPP